jgi:thiol-disulfide isomerase/thioredoxin
MFRASRYYIYTALILTLAAGWIWITRAPAQSSAGEVLSMPHPGFPAPDFSVSSLNGSTITLSDLKGKPVILNIWASWCLPCRAEMPALDAMYKEYAGEGLNVLALNATNQDDLADVNRFILENQIAMPVFLDIDGQISNRYQVRSLPTTFFIDSMGIVNDVVVGEMSDALVRIWAKNLLAESEGQ